MSHAWNQQGDVKIHPISRKPSGTLKKLDHLTLAEGEATGHAHRAIGDADLYVDEAGNLFLHVKGEAGVQVVHEEHAAQTIEKGWKKIEKVKEYDHFQEEARDVRD